MFALTAVLEVIQEENVQQRHKERKDRRKTERKPKAKESQDSLLAKAMAAAWENNEDFNFHAAVAGLKSSSNSTEDKKQASDSATSTESEEGQHTYSGEEPPTTQANSAQNSAEEGVDNKTDADNDVDADTTHSATEDSVKNNIDQKGPRKPTDLNIENIT